MRFIIITIPILFFAYIAVSCSGCSKKSQEASKAQETEIDKEDSAEIDISEISFGDNWNKISKTKKISKVQYDSLQLGKLSFILPHEEMDYAIGSILIDRKNKKLLTIKSIPSGEISEYLLGYTNNEISDSLLVAYEDAVEYFSETFSTIENNLITVITINWDYSSTKNNEGIADTIISKYIITPEITFDEIIDE